MERSRVSGNVLTPADHEPRNEAGEPPPPVGDTDRDEHGDQLNMEPP